MKNEVQSIIIGAGHLGLPLKEALIEHLREKDINVTDIGAYSDAPVNCPDIAVGLARHISNRKFQHGILVCGTSVGMAITANKISGVRAVVIHGAYSAERAIASNNQIAAFGSLVVGVNSAKKNQDIWLESICIPGSRSQPKVDWIDAIDRQRDR